MLSIFKGKWRGLGQDPEQDVTFAKLDVAFRNHLHHFKGAKFHVFVAIFLHMDENGLSFPSYDTLEKETGYGRATISTALDELCEMEVEGQRVLIRYRDRDAAGQYAGGNRYIVFPTDEEIKDNQSSVFPTVEKSNGGKTELEEEPSVKEEPETPSSEDPDGSSPAESPAPSKPVVVHEDDLTQTDDLFYAIACEIFDFQTKTELAAAPSTRSRVNAVVKAFRADHPTATGSDIRAFKAAWQAKEGSPDLPKGEQTLPDNYRTWQKEQAAAPAPSGPRTISLVEEGETL